MVSDNNCLESLVRKLCRRRNPNQGLLLIFCCSNWLLVFFITLLFVKKLDQKKLSMGNPNLTSILLSLIFNLLLVSSPQILLLRERAERVHRGALLVNNRG